MLLSQQAKLVTLTTDKAIVHVSSNWMGMVQNRISLLEEAISNTLGSHRKLILENQIEANPVRSKTEEKSTMGGGINLENKNTEGHSVINNDSNSTKDVESIEASKTPKRRDAKINEPSNESLIDKKVQQFADFFNGKILDIDD